MTDLLPLAIGLTLVVNALCAIAIAIVFCRLQALIERADDTLHSFAHHATTLADELRDSANLLACTSTKQTADKPRGHLRCVRIERDDEDEE